MIITKSTYVPNKTARLAAWRAEAQLTGYEFYSGPNFLSQKAKIDAALASIRRAQDGIAKLQGVSHAA